MRLLDPSTVLLWPLLAFAACAAPQQGDSDATVSPTDTGTAAPQPCRATVANPAWWQQSVGYEIFVRSFQDSNGDGIGDFQGLRSRLDYLNDGKPGGNDLGIDLIWLMPVQTSPSYHGYDVTDYRAIEPDYGTQADFDAFLSDAHARGIRVIVDLVLNHTSSAHPWFADSAAGTGHADWYAWRADNPGWKQPFGSSTVWHPHTNAQGKRFYYGVFWQGMPDLLVTTPAVTQELRDIAKFWLQKGVDGYRLDAVRYLVEEGPKAGQQDTQATLQWWQDFAAVVAQTSPQALLVGEAWASNAIAAKYHVGGKGLGMTFDFDMSTALRAAVEEESADKLQKVVCAWDATFPQGAGRGTFLTNHDMIRIATQFGGDEATGARLRLVAQLLFAVPGTPFVYYGEELGLPNGDSNADEDKRRPMPWTTGANAGFTTGTPWYPVGDVGVSAQAQQADPQSLWALYRQLIQLRRVHPALSVGSLTPLPGQPEGVWAVLRQAGEERVVVACNLAPQLANWQGVRPVELGGVAGDALELVTGATVPEVDGVVGAGTLNGRTCRFVRMASPDQL